MISNGVKNMERRYAYFGQHVFTEFSVYLIINVFTQIYSVFHQEVLYRVLL